MALIRLSTQSLNASLNWEKFEANLLDGADFDISAGNRDSTWTGLRTPTNPADAVPKDYVDGLVDSNMKSPDGFATTAGAAYPTDYKGTGAIAEGDVFYITSIANGTLVGGLTVNLGDMLVALVDSASADAEWIVVESNRDQATETVLGVSKIATQALVNAGTNDTDYITPLKLTTWFSNTAGASNGLHLNGTVPYLGGDLVEDTIVLTQGNDFWVRESSYNAYFYLRDNGSSDYRVGMGISHALIKFESVNGNESGNLEISDTARFHILMNGTSDFIIGDYRTVKTGLVYLGDYSASFVDRSLVDKEYVDNAISGVAILVEDGNSPTGQVYTMTAGDTTTTIDRVYLNGIRQESSMFTLGDNGTNVTITSAGSMAGNYSATDTFLIEYK